MAALRFPLYICMSLLVNLMNASTRTRIAIGSCIFPRENKEILSKIAARNPDLFIMSGDATYLDHSTIDLHSNLGILKGHFIGVDSGIGNKSSEQLESDWKSIWQSTVHDKHWQTLKQQTEIIAVWDDHDYGQNDGDFTNPHRELAKQLFLDAMEVDGNDVRRTRSGVYYHYPLQVPVAGTLQTIDIILLDIRYFAKENGAENILGDEQWKWLQHTLRNELRGELCLIVSGIQITPISRKKTSEGWSRFSASQQRLFQLLNEIKLEQHKEIVLVSGDVHRGEIMKTVCRVTRDTDEYYQELTEVTSSGLTHSIGDDAPIIIRSFVKLLHWMESDGITQCLWRGKNFGEIDIEWSVTENGDGKPKEVRMDQVRIQLLDDEMESKCEHVIQPMVNANAKWNKVLSSKEYAPLLSARNMQCYGANALYTEQEKYWQQQWFNLAYLMIPILPSTILLAIIFCCLRRCCCSSRKQKTE